MEIGNYKEYSINRDSELFIKSFFDEISNSRLYMLVVNNCIEIRTEKQHRILLESLKRRALETNNYDDKKRYDWVIFYSKPVNLVGNDKITLGRELVFSRRLEGKVVVEKCKNCVRIWHPKVFYDMKDNSKIVKSRR